MSVSISSSNSISISGHVLSKISKILNGNSLTLYYISTLAHLAPLVVGRWRPWHLFLASTSQKSGRNLTEIKKTRSVTKYWKQWSKYVLTPCNCFRDRSRTELEASYPSAYPLPSPTARSPTLAQMSMGFRPRDDLGVGCQHDAINFPLNRLGLILNTIHLIHTPGFMTKRLKIKLIVWSILWLNDCLIVRLLVVWLFDCLIAELLDCLIDCLIDWLIDCLIVWLIVWLSDWLLDC